MEPRFPGPDRRRVSRRRFLQASAATTLGLATGATPAFASVTSRRRDRPYNILFVLTDQERHFDAWPFPLPGREALRRMGVSFDNHQIAANVCSPSRSVIYTGQHIQRTGVYDNVNTPWQASMSDDIPTLGHRLNAAGYATAYKGKFHLATELEEEVPEGGTPRLKTDVLARYGFDDYYGVGDIIANTRGGYQHDGVTTAMALRWLRARAPLHAEAGRPWFLAVNLINPHDAMYLDTDLPEEPVQSAGDPVMDIRRPPDVPLYRASWDVPLPATRSQSFTAPGRPAAHAEFAAARSVLLGDWPDEDRRWRALQDYYFNCIRDSDRHIVALLQELEARGELDSTVIVLTSDHGELGGAHGLHGKGACAYREQNHVPLLIAHPDAPGGRRCRAVTSHVDLVPTLLGVAGAETPEVGLPGRDLLPLLARPEAAPLDAVRDAALFSFNMFAYLDGDFLRRVKALRDAGKLGKVPAGVGAAASVKPALDKRGAIRSLFDGRYRYTRYFSPRKHHLPRTLEELGKHNDVELYDLQEDPSETRNLAAGELRDAALLEDRNARLNALIEDEVGEDDGSSLPLSRLADWDLEGADL